MESMINAQINPELNKNWAQDLHEKAVDPEIDEVITRSRQASICCLDPKSHEQLMNGSGVITSDGVFLAIPRPLLGGETRRNSMSTIPESGRLPEFPSRSTQDVRRGQQSRRTRTVSMNPPAGVIWIGV